MVLMAVLHMLLFVVCVVLVALIHDILVSIKEEMSKPLLRQLPAITDYCYAGRDKGGVDYTVRLRSIDVGKYPVDFMHSAAGGSFRCIE